MPATSTELDRDQSPRYALRSSLATIVPASAAPYGYTLSIWSTGALLLRSHGTPSTADTLMFVAGAIAGFNLLGAIAVGDIRHTRSVERRQDRVLAGVLDWVALGAVLAVVFAISRIHGSAPWILGPLAATIVYLLVASLQLAALIVERAPDRREHEPPSR
ncbi:MAG TPA: hypothetical protein VMF57_13115 [Solirubrobacteraceae bacterium]|nr:hypothetical protein [Solirubrobacteraceae bacterium]